MKRLDASRLSLFACFLFAAPAFAGDTGHVTPSPAAELEKNTAEYRLHESTLANWFMEGRAPGTRGNRLAADYIQFNLERLGLAPAFTTEAKNDKGEETKAATWRQEFTAPPSLRPGDSVKIRQQNVLWISPGSATHVEQLGAGEDFNVIGYSGSGDVTGQVVFVGYGIAEGKDGYTNFPKDLDLKGKIAMVMRFEPLNADGKSNWSDVGWTTNAALDGKFHECAERGATGIIFVSPPGVADDRAGRLEDMSLMGRSVSVPVVMMSREAADTMVKALDDKHRSLADLRHIADTDGKPVTLSGGEAHITVSLEKVPLLTDNVGGVLPGVGPLADQWIVVGSHYDHVGYGYFGSREGAAGKGKIHPGADDNASGSSGNLLVARLLRDAYAAMPADQPRRSVLFLWFSAEESGLNGSQYFVNHPSVPLDKIDLMLNMDMIGRLRPDADHDNKGKLEVGGVGTGVGLDEWTKPYWAESGLSIKPTRIGASNSDHYSFQLKDVPNLFFFTGLHSEYHTSKDTIYTINFEGAAKVADLVYRIALDAATRPEQFKFEKDDRHSDDEKDDQAQGPLGGVRVKFGIMPGNYSDDEAGVLIGGLSGDQWPAAKAGLKAGDRMLTWNGEKIDSVEGWMKQLVKAKPGDVVEIGFTRKVDGKEEHMTTKATMVEAPKGKRE
ncbi:MAG: M28 family peptidase [Tepidisphaera sp.]|nr:M28 family peptidase [Tepidisphaera sp.]